MLKKLSLVGVLLIISIGAYAQTTDNGNIFTETDTKPAAPHEVYCEIVSYGTGLFTNKVKVEIDFGQYAKWWSLDNRLVDEDGKDLVFNSLLDAANYMAERGWVFKQAYVTQNISEGDSGVLRKYWIMAKTVTSPEQISEGLRTKRMASGK